MDSTTRKVAAVGAVALLVAIASSAVVSFWQIPEAALIASLRARWVVNDIAIRLIDLLIPLNITVLAVVFSLLVNPADIGTTAGRTASFFSVAQRVLALVIVSTVVYAGVLGILRPIAVEGRAETLADSSIAAELLERAQRNREEERPAEAVRNYRSYLALDPDNAEVMAELEVARGEMQEVQETDADEQGESFTSASSLEGMSFGEVIREARRRFEAEDFFTAHWFATRALDLDPDSRQARQIAARARDALSQPVPSEQEEQEAELFRRKREGYLALYENNQPIEAYYIFRELREDAPRDPDVNRFYDEVLERVRSVSFFIEDAQEAVDLPGRHDLVFRGSSGENAEVFAWIDKLVVGVTGTYAYGIEALSLDGRERGYHFSAEYGKVVDGVLNMRGIARDAPQPRALPTYYSGSRSPEEQALLRLPAGVETLSSAAYVGDAIEEAGILQLFEMATTLEGLGHRLEPVHRELLRRLTLPFAFAVLSILAVAFGWKWRNHTVSRPSIGKFALTPLVYLAAVWVTALYVHLHQAISALLVASSSLWIAALVLVSLEGVLLIGALVVFAGQKTR